MVNQQMAEYPVFTKAPYFLRFQAMFPYVQGLHFARAGLVLGGWKRLNQCFANPPTSTEQIFQPESYFKPSADATWATDPAARPLTLPPPVTLERTPGLKRVEDNIMGELGYDALVGQLLSTEEADRVTLPWVADRYLIYEGPARGQFTLVARTRWSSAQAAGAFCDGYRTILEKRWLGAAGGAHRSTGADIQTEKPGSASEVVLRIAGARQAFLLRKGDECRWAEGVPEEQAEALERWLAALP